jgi:alpha-L-fucosidase 2
MRYFLPLFLAAVAAAQPVEKRPPAAGHGLRYTAPALYWDEALPLGNGMLGALVWGDGAPLKISLDRADLWDLRKVPEFSGPDYKFTVMEQWHGQGRVQDLLRVYDHPYNRPAPTKIPAGRLELRFPRATAFRSAELRLADAVGTTSLEGATVEVFVHATEPVGMVRIAGTAPEQVRLLAPAFGAAKTGQTPKPGELGLLGYPAPKISEGENWQAYTQNGSEGFRYAAFLEWRVTPAGRVMAWSVCSSLEAADPLVRARAKARAALDRGFDSMLASHSEWWRRFWLAAGIRVPNPVVERQWYLETYKTGAASRRGAPPITLQAVWTADDGTLPPWKGDYHHDLNTQLSYWPVYSGNHLEEGLAYLDWLWKTRDTAFEWTRMFYGMPGLNVPMTADLNGRQIGGWRQYTHSATTAAWLAHHFYQHWKYSGDRQFLRERAWPYIRDAAVFVEAFTARKDALGRRTHPLSASPEINDNRPEAWFDSVTNFDLALERWVTAAAAELAGELRLREEAARWRRVRDEFPDFSYGEDGRLLIAAGYPLKESHRHFSHLLAIQPLGLIDWDQGESSRRTIRAALAELDRLGPSRWCGYSWSWLANLAARGRDGALAERAIETFARAHVSRNSFHVNWDQSKSPGGRAKSRPFTLEGNFAAASGIQEMLLQSHAGMVRVFPAVPESWRDAEFATLRAEGGFLVSARRKDGRTTRIEIQSERGGVTRVASPRDGSPVEVRLRPGETRVLE